MKRGREKSPTLAAVLDRTQWDYSPDTDRRILLSSVERLFASVVWEISSRRIAALNTPGAAIRIGNR